MILGIIGVLIVSYAFFGTVKNPDGSPGRLNFGTILLGLLIGALGVVTGI